MPDRHDRLIVRRIEEGEQQSGGIIIPDTARETATRHGDRRPEAEG